MKWIIFAILVFIAGYTFLTLHYRKQGKAYEPYADMRNRANTGRLLAAGYQRVPLAVERPADLAMKTNTAYPAPGGLPTPLKTTLVAVPRLPSDIIDAHAPTTISSDEAYTVLFRCVTPDDKQQLGGAELYVKGDEIVITPDFDRLTGGLQARTRDTLATLTIPAHTLKPGAYRVSLIGENTSRAWRLQVR